MARIMASVEVVPHFSLPHGLSAGPVVRHDHRGGRHWWTWRQFVASPPKKPPPTPSLILAAAQLPDYQGLIDATLRQSRQHIGPAAPAEEVISKAIDELSVRFGEEILKVVPGRVSTEVDARLSYDTEATIGKARQIIGRYETAGLGRERGVDQNCLHVGGDQGGGGAGKGRHSLQPHLAVQPWVQAVACAEAGVTLISPFVGRILDWHKKADRSPGLSRSGRSWRTLRHPDLHLLQNLRPPDPGDGGQFPQRGGKSSNWPAVTCSPLRPKFLDQLGRTEGLLVRKLDPASLTDAPRQQAPGE